MNRFDSIIIGAGQAGPSLAGNMNAGVPYEVLERAVPIHPTVSELIPAVLGELRPLPS